LRQSHLILDHLSKHPDAKTKEGKAALTSTLKALPDVVVNLEQLKPIIEREYNEWRAQDDEKKEQRANRAAASRKRTAYEQRASRDPALSSKAKVLDAGENLDLAVDLAQNEFKRRDANRKASRLAGVSAEEEQSRRTAGFWNNWTDELARRQVEDEELFRRQMESTRANLDGNGDSHIHDFVQKMSRADREASREDPYANSIAAANYHYPSISKSTPVDYDRSLPKPRTDPTPQPPRPPKDLIRRPIEAPPPVPELPSKELLYSFPPSEPSRGPPALPPKDQDLPPEPLATKTNREHLTFKPAAYLENGEPIRCVVFPSKMRLDFLRIAADNTRRGIEMCGILCGTAVNNALFVRCLVIPEQKCTPDTCETENEGALFDFCEKEDLLQLGWIHTHPTQSCFMSSRDLHTQSGYQIMLPESIAIVCAPKFEPS
jgi:STAM-binding protein